MRLRKIPEARTVVGDSPIVISETDARSQINRWQQQFTAAQPLYLEIGCGRGRFITEAAAAFPDINWIGWELREEMLLMTLRRLEQPLANLRLIWGDAAYIDQVFSVGEIERIYLNFPDPWPKNRHAKRRLTSDSFLKRYGQILTTDGQIFFKTDDKDFFDISRENFAAESWQEIAAGVAVEPDMIISEYEARYRRQGKAIYYCQYQRR